MMPISDQAKSLIDDLIAALEAKPDEGRSFCIPNLNGPQRVVIHKGLPNGSLQISRGLPDELVQGGLLGKVEPFDKRNCLYDLTELAFEQRAAAKPIARVRSAGRTAVLVLVAVTGVVAAIVTILMWAGVGPTL